VSTVQLNLLGGMMENLTLTANDNFLFTIYLCAYHYPKPLTGIILLNAHHLIMSIEVSLS
jgi:hypothetical protein